MINTKFLFNGLSWKVVKRMGEEQAWIATAGNQKRWFTEDEINYLIQHPGATQEDLDNL